MEEIKADGMQTEKSEELEALKRNGSREKIQKIKEIIQASDMVLLGFGDQFSEKTAEPAKILKAYEGVSQLIQGKPWFAVTVNTDDLIYESGMNRFFVVAPCGSQTSGNVITNENYDESEYLPQWQFYMNWLSATLGKRLCILELGVGLTYPSVIRMPFEKMAMINQKAFLIRIHSKLAQVPEELAERSLCIPKYPVDFLLEKR